MKPIITQQQLREVLHYDKDSGSFTWIANTGNRHRIGDTAGHLCKTGELAGYITIRIFGRSYMAHRLAWLYIHGEFPSRTLDHKDTNRSNNRLGNLRQATQSQNNANTNLRVDNKSGRKGVCFDIQTQKWMAQTRINGKTIKLGRFTTLDEAAAAYDKALIDHHGSFARTNHMLSKDLSKEIAA